MGFRFRKSFKVMPGVRLNLSKSGTSWSFGGPGATVNVKGRRVRGTVGIPGTGISYSEQITEPEQQPQGLMQAQPAAGSGGGFLMGLVIAAVVLGVYFLLRH